jgi:diguanylate cyclase (GGDEF)-like protein
MSSDEPQTTATVLPRAARRGRGSPYLIVLSGPQFGEVFDLDPGTEILLGRHPDAQVWIRDEGVSRRHATLAVGPDGAHLTDLGSANGTWIDGLRVTEHAIRDGARFQLGGHTTLKFVQSDALDAEYQRLLVHGALHEPLTGLYNRRHFVERLVAEVAAARRHVRPVSLLLADVDHFRRVNDTLGRVAGDEALKMVAWVLQGAVRKEDVVARFGGEEFVILARETGAAGAKALAERIRRAVERSRCTFEGQELNVTLSVGVAVTAGNLPLEEGADQQLLEAADRALASAKEAGRNCVASSPPLGE